MTDRQADCNWIKYGISLEDLKSIERRYSNKIVKHKITGSLARVSSIMPNGMVTLRNQGGSDVFKHFDLVDFEQLYEVVGVVKYTENELAKMLFEAQE